jgi:hypothetical protein
MKLKHYNRAAFVDKCRSKLWFQTQKEAEVAVKEIQDRHGIAKRIYQCVICDLYHLSKRPLDVDLECEIRFAESAWRNRARQSA